MNPLYKYPAEANLLKSGKRSDAYREAWKKLADVSARQASLSPDSSLHRLYVGERVLQGISIVLAALYVLAEILMFHVLPQPAEAGAERNYLHVLLLLAIAVPAVLCYVGHEYGKDSILRRYLKEYEPVCSQYGAETLREIGRVLRGEHENATANYVCLRCRRGCRYDQTVHTRDEMFCPVCGGDTLVGRITGYLFDACCNYQAELDARTESESVPAEEAAPAERIGKDGKMPEISGNPPAD